METLNSEMESEVDQETGSDSGNAESLAVVEADIQQAREFQSPEELKQLLGENITEASIKLLYILDSTEKEEALLQVTSVLRKGLQLYFEIDPTTQDGFDFQHLLGELAINLQHSLESKSEFNKILIEAQKQAQSMSVRLVNPADALPSKQEIEERFGQSLIGKNESPSQDGRQKDAYGAELHGSGWLPKVEADLEGKGEDVERGMFPVVDDSGKTVAVDTRLVVEKE